MEKLLCPSMMCANFASLKKEIKDLEKGGIDIFHLDVMDGYQQLSEVYVMMKYDFYGEENEAI